MAHFCTECGSALAPGVHACPHCGTPVGHVEVGATGPVPAPPPPLQPPPRDNTALIVGGVLLAILLVLVGGAALLLISRSDSGTNASDTTLGPLPTTAPTTVSTTIPTTVPTTVPTTLPTTVPTTLGDVRAQPAGLLCKDLQAKGFSYSASVDYWRVQGQPDRMDADKNGIPCETVYPRGDVTSYWGTTPLPEYQAVPTGLQCRDLKARGYSYPEAAAYWFATGSPDNMDADLNGIPCETVYSADEVAAYWYG